MNRVFAERYSVFTALSVGTTDVAPFTAYSGLTLAFLTLEGSAVRYRLDGISATSGSGHLATASMIIKLAGAQTITNTHLICPTVTGTIMASLGVE